MRGTIVCRSFRNLVKVFSVANLVFTAANDNVPFAAAWNDDVPSGLLTLY